MYETEPAVNARILRLSAASELDNVGFYDEPFLKFERLRQS